MGVCAAPSGPDAKPAGEQSPKAVENLLDGRFAWQMSEVLLAPEDRPASGSSTFPPAWTDEVRP
jgi:hypothetical protein